MTNFYQTSPSEETTTVQVEPPQPYQNTSTRVAGGVTSINFRGDTGALTTTRNSTVSAADLTPYAESDWRATARNAHGNPTSKITEECVVEVDGMSAQVGMLVKAGILVETPEGFVKATQAATEGATEEDTPEPGAMPAETVDAINSAMEGLSNSTVQHAGALGIAAAVGDSSLDEVIAGVARDTGMEPTEAAQRVTSKAFLSSAVSPPTREPYRLLCNSRSLATA